MSEGWVELVLEGEQEADTIIGATAGARPLVAVLHKGEWRVFADTCTHAQCAFTEFGEIAADDGVIICNCHGAEFALADGTVTLEPADVPLALLPVRETADGGLEVQLG